MRITAGKFARRVLTAPPGAQTRPTSDRARQAVFNILAHHDWGRDVIAGAAVLDICCGTGALALEALSRGASTACLIEQDRAALQAARRNIAALNVQTICRLIEADATRPPPAPAPCTLIFLDPPYNRNLPAQILPALEKTGWLAPQALLVIETAARETLPLPPPIRLVLRRDYGAAAMHFCLFQPP